MCLKKGIVTEWKNKIMVILRKPQDGTETTVVLNEKGEAVKE